MPLSEATQALIAEAMNPSKEECNECGMTYRPPASIETWLKLESLNHALHDAGINSYMTAYPSLVIEREVCDAWLVSVDEAGLFSVAHSIMDDEAKSQTEAQVVEAMRRVFP